MPLIVLGAVTLVLVVILTLVIRATAAPSRASRRREQAEARGWAYTRSSATWPTPYFAEEVARGGDGFAQATGIVRGPLGETTFTAFTAIPRNQAERAAGVVILHLHARLPRFCAAQDGPGQDRYSAWGGPDLPTGWPEFDRLYRVRADDPVYARQLLSPELMAWLAAPERRARTFTIVGNELLTWHEGHLHIDEVSDWLIELAGFAQRIPTEVWRVYGQLVTPEPAVVRR
ncbi:MAG: DUF3137 domain-containing protein [Propionibacteriaceae bacterium]|nr:DUF3137 domain-containing protein [Propionibacteriaceae bacterium]